MVNQCRKGKRVERNIVNWLKERGCSSARRSAQHCGFPTETSTGSIDNSDILVPDELPSWHIESKGTKSPKLIACKIKNWFLQLRNDCPAGKLGVILHTANAYSPIALVSLATFMKLAKKSSMLSISVDDSISPAIELLKMAKGARIHALLAGHDPSTVKFTGAIAFMPDSDQVVVALRADLWLEWALELEKNKTQLELIK